MPEQEEKLDVEKAIELLNAALRLQHRSTLQYTLNSGSLFGFEFQAFGDRFWEFAKAELDAAGIEYTERRYLEDVPTTAELAEVLDRMGLQPWDIARPKETKEAGINLPKDTDHRQEWLAAMVAVLPFYLASGLVAPLWAIIGLLLCWAGFFYLGLRWRKTRPYWVLALPVVAFAWWWIALTVGEEALVLEIVDNGVGLGEITRRSGLDNLRVRAEQYGGTLEVGPAGHATPHREGTHLRWTIPL